MLFVVEFLQYVGCLLHGKAYTCGGVAMVVVVCFVFGLFVGMVIFRPELVFW